MSSAIESQAEGKLNILEMKEHPNPADRNIQNGSLQEVLIDKNQRRSSPSCSLRRLAIMSIVCGISCVGIKALLLALRVSPIILCLTHLLPSSSAFPSTPIILCFPIHSHHPLLPHPLPSSLASPIFYHHLLLPNPLPSSS
ncbi:hypothetical protein AB205_0081870, partial [Aquarana catesbeiana]